MCPGLRLGFYATDSLRGSQLQGLPEGVLSEGEGLEGAGLVVRDGWVAKCVYDGMQCTANMMHDFGFGVRTLGSRRLKRHKADTARVQAHLFLLYVRMCRVVDDC